MRFPRIRFTLWLTIFCAEAFFLLNIAGCGGPDVALSFPLDDGASWTYQGTTTYKIAGQEQTMPPLTFNLKERSLSPKSPAPFEFDFGEEGQNLLNLQLVESPNGLVDPLTGQLWLPREVKTGKSWNVTVQGNKVRMTLGHITKITVPAGTFSAYVIVFKGPRKDHGAFWLYPGVGIIAFDWTSRTPGGESQTNLQLSSYSLP